MSNWNYVEGGRAAIATTIGSCFAEHEKQNPAAFPNLRQDPCIVVASDYSGDHRESDYQVATFLISNISGLSAHWEPERLRIREEHLPDGRRIEFKGLSDARRQRAVVPFLNATEKIDGMLLCIAFEKSLSKIACSLPFNSAFESKPKVFARLSKIASIGAAIISGLSAKGQDVHWITDDDEIVSNEAVSTEFATQVSGWLKECHAPDLTGVNIGIASKFDDNRRAEDLCSIPDLVGGAVAEQLNATNPDSIPRSSNLANVLTSPLSTKSALIWEWAGNGRGRLKRHLILVRDDGVGKVLVSFAAFQKFGPAEIQHGLWLPPDKGWRKSSESW